MAIALAIIVGETGRGLPRAIPPLTHRRPRMTIGALVRGGMTMRPDPTTTIRARPFTCQEFLESLRGPREIWIYGERVADVTTHPAFATPRYLRKGQGLFSRAGCSRAGHEARGGPQ